MKTGLLTLALVAMVSAQVTSIKLPKKDTTASFRVLDSAGAIKLKINGDGGFVLVGPQVVGGVPGIGTIPASGGGTRMMWYPAKAAFRAGYIGGSQWDSTNIGVGSGVIGCNSTVSGWGSFSAGNNHLVSGSNSVAMGYNNVVRGNVSFAIGSYTEASGNYSTALGNGVSTDSFPGAFIIGDGHTQWPYTSSTDTNQMTMRFDGGYRLFSNYFGTTGVTLAAGGNAWATISDSAKKTNFKKADGDYFLSSLSKLKLGSWNYKAQNAEAKNYRHYGPMAQEIYHYFGSDGKGSIGNDTTLSTADMDGIMMICLQSLEKRTSELQIANQKLAVEQTKVTLLQSSVDEMKTEMMKMKIELQGLAAAKSNDAKSKVALSVNDKGE